MLRQLYTKGTFNHFQHVKSHVEEILKKSNLYSSLRNRISVPRSLREQSASVLRIWAYQCECVLAQRLRRGQQMFCLYSKLWEERALREFIKQMKFRIGTRGRDFLIGALGVTAYDWGKNKICDSEITLHSQELEYVHTLRDKTLCGTCSKKSKICQCEGIDGPKNHIPSYDNWTLFIQKNDLVVWRRLHNSGQFEYKVFGSYDDVTAEEFLSVQVDINYRKRWDKTAVNLNVVEVNPDKNTNTDVIYWEMLWPKLFANRDYVFLRRYYIDYKSKTLYLFSRSTTHPRCPKDQTKYRIDDYWSYMVIKPYTDLNKQGIEFSLTYYDNPGVNIPAAVTTWVATKAMPDFLERLREATRQYRKYCQETGSPQICSFVYSQERDVFSWDYFDDDITDNTIYEAHYRLKRPEEVSSETPQTEPTAEGEENDTGSSNNSSPGINTQPESHSFWRYIKKFVKIISDFLSSLGPLPISHKNDKTQ